MGIYTPGFIWPGIDPELPADPIDYDSGDCGIIETPLWGKAVNEAWELKLGDLYSDPTIQADGSIGMWVYSWVWAVAVSRVGYLTPSGLSVGTTTGSSIGSNFTDSVTRHVGNIRADYPVIDGNELDFAWGADPANLVYAYEHSYKYDLPIWYGCAEPNEDEQILGFWYTIDEANAILAEWEHGLVTDCCFVSACSVYTDMFYFPLSWFANSGVAIGTLLETFVGLGVMGGGHIAAVTAAVAQPPPTRRKPVKKKNHVK